MDGETGTVAWYDGDPDGTGTVISPATAVNLNNVTDLYAQVTLTGTNCVAAVDASLTINPLPTPADPNIVICADETSTDLTTFDTKVLDGETIHILRCRRDRAFTATFMLPQTQANINILSVVFAQATWTVTNCFAAVDT